MKSYVLSEDICCAYDLGVKKFSYHSSTSSSTENVPNCPCTGAFQTKMLLSFLGLRRSGNIFNNLLIAFHVTNNQLMTSLQCPVEDKGLTHPNKIDSKSSSVLFTWAPACSVTMS